jgi:benzoyl-CoA reductase/2-hydroxyglutaryl-CoA dehydratase subunit BcrC/BadD/HgdB
MKALDDANLQVVGDDLTLGGRYYSGQISENLEPIEALNEYYTKIPRPTTQISHEEHIEYLLKELENQKVDGIIAQNLEFCKPYSLDMVHTIKHLKEKGFKVAHLENHHDIYSLEVKTKLEAFRSLI